jgi:hypothetical protein
MKHVFPTDEVYHLWAHQTEQKAAGWVDYREHPDGLLSRPCPVCGYKYGSAWLYEEIPADVIAWLQALPDTDRKPAWI